MQTPFIYRNSDGVKRTMHPQGEDAFTIHTELELDEILAGIRRDADNHKQGALNKTVARLPMTVVEDLMNRGIWHDDDAMKKWLNSYEAAPWRIWRGRV